MSEPVRLSKLMAQRGICSRREADRFIEQGLVSVDGEVVDQLGSRILPHQKITLSADAREQQAKKTTVLLNKPPGYVSGTPEDGYQPAAALLTRGNAWHKSAKLPDLRGLAPAGRLDIDSSGLMVLTNDGRVARQLIAPDSKIEKEYVVNVRGNLTAQDLGLLRHGLELDGRKLKPAQVSQSSTDQLIFVLTEGRKRQVRRMCKLVGLEVVSLIRVRVGNIRLGKLPRGKWRLLGPGEKF